MVDQQKSMFWTKLTVLAKAVDDYKQAEDWSEIGAENFSGHAPFPFLDMYCCIVRPLIGILEEKRGFFVFSLVTELGQRVNAKEAGYILNGFPPLQKDFSLYSILNDKQLHKLVTALKEVFDKGYKEFSQSN